MWRLEAQEEAESKEGAEGALKPGALHSIRHENFFWL